MGKLKETVINTITDNLNSIVLNRSDESLVDKYIGPFLLMRAYKSNITIYYQGNYDRLTIPRNWFDLFESIDVLQGDNVFGTSEPSDDIEKFIYLFFKFSRGTRIRFSYNTDDAARLLLDELYKLGTSKFINFLDSSCGIKLEPWKYENISTVFDI